jgi:hypothetical protein
MTHVLFIDFTSGGQHGSGSIKTYSEFLNEAQVLSIAFAELVMLKLYVPSSIAPL